MAKSPITPEVTEVLPHLSCKLFGRDDCSTRIALLASLFNVFVHSWLPWPNLYASRTGSCDDYLFGHEDCVARHGVLRVLNKVGLLVARASPPPPLAYQFPQPTAIIYLLVFD